MFCEQCASVTRQLIFDPTAEPGAELLSGSLMWSDEIGREWCLECRGKMRHWFHFRYQLVVGERVPPEALEAWRQMERDYPNWPLFRPERCSSDNPEQVRHLVRRATRKACVALERLDREYRKRQAEKPKEG